jgi:predicted 3-demethylubiquinone-9 3-methyltransferase (glyoxalase superfamily)
MAADRRHLRPLEGEGGLTKLTKITPCLWFDDQAEAAARFYVSIFPDAGIDQVARYGEEGFEVHGRPAGSVLTVVFHLLGQSFVALNGGPLFKFNEAVSFQVFCDTQAEIDRYWRELTVGGEESQCGWLKDRFGLSWQVAPSALPAMMSDPDPRKGERVMKAILPMKKLDVATLERAFRAG